MVLPVVLVLEKVIDMLDEQNVDVLTDWLYYYDSCIDWDQLSKSPAPPQFAFREALITVSSVLYAALDLQRSSAAYRIEDAGAPPESTDES